jgi:hypothetical protein
MPNADVALFERVAGDALDTLGYERVATRPGEKAGYSEADVLQFERENERLKHEVMGQVDPGDRERRDRQAGLIRQIRERQLLGNTAWVNI